MSEKLVLIDGHSIINRAFYGVPDLTNSAGLHTNAIYGFLNILFKLLDEEQPDYLVVAFDEHAPTFRHEMYPEYKGTRGAMADELREQVPVLRQLLEAMQVMCVSKAGYEADDLLGTLAKKSEKAGIEVKLVSGDRDLLQIATEHICIRIPHTKGGKTTIDDFYAKDVREKYQVDPDGFIQLKALMGDTSDNVPGVPKVGEKTATQLLVEFGSIENLYAHLDQVSKKSIRESLEQNRELLDLSLKLVTIKTDCEVELDRENARAEGFFTPEAYEIVKRLEFRNLLGRFEAREVQAKKEQLQIRDVPDIHEFFQNLDEDVTQDPAAIGLQVLEDDGSLVAIAAACEVQGNLSVMYCDDMHCNDTVDDCNIVTVGIRNLLEKKNCRIVTCGIKSEYDYFPYLDGEGKEYFRSGKGAGYFDILLGAYLLNPLKNDHDAENIGREYANLNIKTRAELLGKLSLREAQMAMRDAFMQYATDLAYVSLECYKPIHDALERTGMLKLMEEVEMPLSMVLYSMEKEGILVLPQELHRYSKELGERIAEIENRIHAAAGESFNVNSPKQLGEFLFDKMGLPGGKKTKTGYSTAADVLEKLAPAVPFVQDVLEYRGLAKLKSTYADALSGYIAGDGRIHTTFRQTITATGRISSADPNLQNIPIRTQMGRELRRVFVPREGCVFVDADYSQIELRVLASLSGDEGLIEAYRSEQDIHRITASKVFHVPFEEVTELQRRNAKAVNFGIVYGISSFGLSQDLSISQAEAKEYIAQYFETYPGIKGYLDGLVADAKTKGYSETYFGRRRPMPELKSSNFQQRSFGERIAMNAPIQGTAADIIKIAMISVWRELREKKFASRLILQVHDELLIEAVSSEVEAVKELLTRNMQEAADLAVKLEVGIGVGSNWEEAH